MIRPYRPEDLETLVRLGNKAWQPIYDMYTAALGEALFRVRVPDRRTAKGEQIRRHAREHPDQIIVCERDGHVVGFTTWHYRHEGQVAEIGNNAVSPEAAGRGIGSQMYEHVLALFRRKGCEFAQVSTGLDPAHAPARRAYEKVGFNRKTEDVTYYLEL